MITFAPEPLKSCNMEVLLPREYIVEQIIRKGMSKAEFASKMGIARQNLDSLLDSKKKDINTIIKMSEILEIPFLRFIGMEERKTDIHGCIYVDGKPVLINGKEDLLKLTAALGKEDA